MKTIYRAAAAILILSMFHISLTAQEKPTYELRFLNAKFLDTTAAKNIMILFQVLPIQDKDFPPILSTKVTYSIGDNGVEKTIDIVKGENKARINVLGPDLNEKYPEIYALAKEKLDTTRQRYLVLALYLDDVATQMFDKMAVTYGLWEKNNPAVRIEKKFAFTVYR